MLDEPRYPLLEIPEFDDPSWVVVSAGPYAWNCDASRQLENFTDFGHFPWVHPGLLGDPSRPVVPEHTVTHRRARPALRDRAPGGAQQRRLPGLRQRGRRWRRSAARATSSCLPYTILLRLGWGGEKGMVYFFASQPIDHERCAGYVLIARNYDYEQPDSVLQEFEDTIFNQDQRRRRVTAAGAGAVRPRGRDAPEVRRGRDRLPRARCASQGSRGGL